MALFNRFKETPEIKSRATKLINLLTRPARQASSQARVHTVAPTSQKFFVGSSNKRAKLIILQVNGLHDESTKKTCEQCLLTVGSLIFYSLRAILRFVMRLINLHSDKTINLL